LECVDSYHIQDKKCIVDIRKALNRFTSEMNNTSLKNNLLFTHDLVDLFRQTFQNLADDLYVDIVKLYREKDLNSFMEKSNLFLSILIDLDELLGSHRDFLFGIKLKAAIETATTEAEKLQYEFNMRNQITLWGPKGQILDYATKQ
jgi:alpha-N-acetylglucosaminidase